MGCLIAQSLLVTLGVYLVPLRMLTIVTQVFCTLGVVGASILLAIFRYNVKGRLASLSLSPSLYVEGQDSALSDQRTYADDGELLQKLFITMVVYIVGQFCLGCLAMAPPTQDRLRKKGINIHE